MTASVLQKIKAYKLEDVAKRRAARPIDEVERAAKKASAPRGFASALKTATQDGYGLIAEVKKASPSKGVIREDFNPVEIATAYQAGGATCLSVLTDKPSFQGDDQYLINVRNATQLPVIRKDFIYDPYQVAESRALGADCILLIMASLEANQAAELESAAHALGMDVLIEVHDLAELESSAHLTSPLLGINNRNLNTFETRLETTFELARHAPADKLLVSESGLFTPEDLTAVAGYGARCFLIGESLMRQDDIEAATRSLLANPLRPMNRY